MSTPTRHCFTYHGRTIYQWTQSLGYVRAYPPPLAAFTTFLDRKIQNSRLISAHSLARCRSDLDLYIPDVPSGVGARDLAITIERKRLVVALKRREGTTHTYLDHALSHAVKASEAIWTFDSEIREVHISLVKAEPSVVWASVFVGLFS